MSAQTKDNYIALKAGVDPAHFVKDYIFQAAVVSENIEINIGYEIFPEIDFSKYTLGLGYHFPLHANVLDKHIVTTFIPTIEPTMISRKDTWGGGLGLDMYGNEKTQNSGHLSIGLNLSLMWRLTDRIAAEYSLNFLPRTDIKSQFPNGDRSKITIEGIPIVTNNYIKFVYLIDRN